MKIKNRTNVTNVKPLTPRLETRRSIKHLFIPALSGVCFYAFVFWAVSIRPNMNNKPNNKPLDIENTIQRKQCNSVYYWKTVFTLNEEEKQWLADHNIERMYIRYFDVTESFSEEGDYAYTPVPKATIRFVDTVPASLEIVPTVFIDNIVFRYNLDMMAYVERLVNRILVMSETNDIGNISEVQLDCDWTWYTQANWFAFAKAVRKELSKHKIILSATIRLHQLNMQPPPVDCGVLMCYNTSGLSNYFTKNSILCAEDVSPYSKYLQSYKLPLDIAYPTFSWAVWFDKYERFQALLRDITPENANLKKRDGNRYTVKNGFYQNEEYIAAGSEIRFEFSDFSEIIKCKQMLEPKLKNYSVILYHLDNKNLSKYTTDEINEIYTRK